MKNEEIDRRALATVIADLGARFRTKDVAEDPRVVAEHPGADVGELNTAVGRVLSSFRGELGIELVDASTSNAMWRQVGSPPA
jgi:hypothetical protein